MVYFTRRNTAAKLPALWSIPTLHVKAAMDTHGGASAVAILVSSVTKDPKEQSFVITRYLPQCASTERAECVALEMGLRYMLHRGQIQCVVDCTTDNVYAVIRGKTVHPTVTPAVVDSVTALVNRFDTVIVSYSCANANMAECLRGYLATARERSMTVLESAVKQRAAVGRPLPEDIQSRFLRQSLTSTFLPVETLRLLKTEDLKKTVDHITEAAACRVTLEVVDQFEQHTRNGTSPFSGTLVAASASAPSAPSASSAASSAAAVASSASSSAPSSAASSASSSAPASASSAPAASSASSVAASSASAAPSVAASSASLASSALAAVIAKEKQNRVQTQRTDNKKRKAEEDDDEDVPLASLARKTSSTNPQAQAPKRAYTSKVKALQAEMASMRALLGLLLAGQGASSSASSSSASL